MSAITVSTQETTQSDLQSTSPRNQLTRSAALVVLQQLIHDHFQNSITYNVTLPEHPLSVLAKGNTPGIFIYLPGVIADEKGNLVDLLATDSM